MPSADPPLLLRRRLIDRLQQSRVALIEAGAGYGKSVLAHQFRQSLEIGAPYVALGPPDRDIGVLIGSMRRALISARLSDLVAATEVEEPARWVERLLDALTATEDEILLIIDDAHHVRTPEAAALLLRLAAGLPPQHRLLVAGRSFDRHLQ